MGKIPFDFHIHTALSPCGDDDMTPNNIVNMSIIKGLDAIAITDHNTCGNVKAVLDAAANAESNLIIIPGMEIETIEEIHVICLFPDLEAAFAVQNTISKYLPKIKNNEKIFGRQIYYNEFDEIKSFEEHLLLTAVQMDIQKIFELVRLNCGIPIPAHIDRSSYSILSNLGFFPKELSVTLVEYSKNIVPENYIRLNPYLENYPYIQSSDAHYLGDISEPEHFLDASVPATSAQDIISILKKLF